MEHFYHKIHGYFDWPELYQKLISEMPENFKFAEIGVWKGRSLSYFIVEAINSGKKFKTYAIDTFKGSIEHQKGEWCYDPITDSENGLYNHFLLNINSVKKYVEVIREDSVSASKKFTDNSLDAVFIDGAHDYVSVKADLNAWGHKVKNYNIYGDDIDWPGVKEAVTEYSLEKNLKIVNICRKCYQLKVK